MPEKQPSSANPGRLIPEPSVSYSFESRLELQPSRSEGSIGDAAGVAREQLPGCRSPYMVWLFIMLTLVMVMVSPSTVPFTLM
jgi:hypothetical protein